MKAVYTFLTFVGVTTLGMIFASGLCWLCTLSFSHFILLSCLALLILFVFSGEVQNNGWKKGFLNALVPMVAGLFLMGCLLWFFGMFTLNALHAAAPADLAIIIGLVAVSAVILAVFDIYIVLDTIVEIGDGKMTYRGALGNLGLFVTVSCCIAIIGLTLYYVIYPICLH